MLLWVIDADSDVMADYTTLLNELTLYDRGTAAKQRFIVLNKIDLISPDALAGRLASLQAAGEAVFAVSAATGEGIAGLKERIGEVHV